SVSASDWQSKPATLLHRRRPRCRRPIRSRFPCLPVSLLVRLDPDLLKHVTHRYLKVVVMLEFPHFAFSVRSPADAPVNYAQTVMRSNVGRIIPDRRF